MFLYIAEFNQENELEFKEEINMQRFTKIIHILDDIVFYTHAKHLRDMSISNGTILYKYLEETINRYKDPLIEISDMHSISEKSNKYIFDFSISIRTFLDYLEKALTEKGEGELFHNQFISNLFDNNVEYQFWYYMRNYIVHYDLPFNSITRDMDGLKIICENSHLLKYKKWGKVKEYILSNKEIPIKKLIKPMQDMIMAMFTQYLYHLNSILSKMKYDLEELIKETNIDMPVLVAYENEEELKKGKIEMYPVGINVLIEAFRELGEHPNVTVTFISKDENDN